MGHSRGRQAPETQRYFLTIAEVMAIFRVGRTTAYGLAREYIATGGCSGIPCQKLGSQLRFPTAEIERLIKRPVTFPIADTEPLDSASSASDPRSRTEHRRDHASEQLALRLPQD